MFEHKTPTLSTVVDTFHQIFPLRLAEEWDSSGLVVGRGLAPVETIGFAVDATRATALEARDRGAGLLITHHPLLLRGLSTLPDTDYKGNIIHTLIEAGCGLLGAHTNVDSAPLGTNEAFMERLGIRDRSVLTDTAVENIDGDEVQVGIGRVGNLVDPTTLSELAQTVASFLPATATGLRVAGRPDQQIHRVALCTGAGDSFFAAARVSGADVYITADLRHHPASEFREQELLNGSVALIDCSHFASEWLWLDGAATQLRRRLREQGYTVDTYISELNTDPWDFTVSTGHTKGSVSTR